MKIEIKLEWQCIEKNVFRMGVNGTKNFKETHIKSNIKTTKGKNMKKRNSPKNTQPGQILHNLHQYSQSPKDRKGLKCKHFQGFQAPVQTLWRRP